MARRRTRTNDPRELPAYTLSEAAHYLGVPAATIRYWSVGRDNYAPLIEVPAHAPTLLSFLNLTELHVLAAIRRQHEVKMPSIRTRDPVPGSACPACNRQTPSARQSRAGNGRA